MAKSRLKDLSYEDWIEHVFCHEVRQHGNAWHFDLDAPLWDGSPEETLAHLTRFFDDPEPALYYFSDAQIDQGLRYIIDNGAGDLFSALRAPKVPLVYRQRCVSAICSLYDKLFLPRCTPHLSHLDRGDTEVGPLNGICYMWWDTFPGFAAPDDPYRKTMNEAVLAAISHGLTLDSIACQESALHGLGHWAHGDAAAVAPIIDAFLEAHPNLEPELKRYALSARGGCVL